MVKLGLGCVKVVKDNSRNHASILLNSVLCDVFNARVEFGLIESRARVNPSSFGPRNKTCEGSLRVTTRRRKDVNKACANVYTNTNLTYSNLQEFWY